MTHLSFDQLSKEKTMEAMNGAAWYAQAVVAKRVAEDARSGCLPRHFGPDCPVVEAHVYDTMARLCRHYDGGYWHYYELSNGGFYMAPEHDGFYDLAVPGNGYAGTVSADVAGIITCAMVYSHLSFVLCEGPMARAFHLLRDYIAVHREAGTMFAALD